MQDTMSVKVLWVLAGMTVAGGAGTAWFALSQFNGAEASKGGVPAPVVPAAAVQATVPPPARVIAPAQAPAPALPVIVAPSGSGQLIVAQAQVPPPAAAPKMPMVQRPTEVAPSQPSESPSGGLGQAVAERGRDNHFRFDATINGVHMPVLFDTGASVLALRAEDAQRLGFDPVTLRYSWKTRTANGVTETAPIMIDTITIGNITQHKIQAVVHRAGTLSENLLGQSFMSGLAGYNVVQNQLVLKGR